MLSPGALDNGGGAGYDSAMPDYLPLSEIRARAVAFSKEWKGETSESAEKQTFWNEFFNIFGFRRRRVATFEEPVKLLGSHRGKIDLFWPGVLLVEHKSAGEDLAAAFRQAANYFEGIAEEDLPQYVMVSDFARFRLYNLDGKAEPVEFPLEKLHLHVGDFAFLTGHKFRPYEDAPKVNVKAAEHMAALHDALRRNRYGGESLAAFLVRLMFCLFADHTGLFPRSQFRDIIERKTRPDGSDVGSRIAQVFAVLDQPDDRRQRNLDEDLAALPYVNGHLFEARYDPPEFDGDARKWLLQCCSYDWSEVSPAIFGAMFQKVMDEDAGKRRSFGAHYTSEKNILKALRPLVLDGLQAELDKAATAPALRAFLKRVAEIAVLDPACGCGNFLVVAYRELRGLELAAYRKLARLDQTPLSIVMVRRIEVDAMYGIEIDPFACRVAETALYLVDHQMNLQASEEFGENYIRLPLNKAPHITPGNALRMDWATVVPAERLTCVVSNPPFIGKAFRTADQSADMDEVFVHWHKHGELDYVAAWYAKSVAYVRNTDVPVAFVSTNSITQGEQVGVLWPRLMEGGAHIFFAHRTFRWDNDAPGQAHVYCVIIGWRLMEPARCRLFDYETPKSEAMEREARRINAYLVDAPDVFVMPRRTPLCAVPRIAFGNMPNDGGHLLLDRKERDELLRTCPAAERYIRRIYGSVEFIHDIERYCLWLVEAKPNELREMPAVMERVRGVREHREKSTRPATRELAVRPTLFGEIRQPRTNYLLIPSVSSENRRYTPMGFMPPDVIASNLALMVADADLFHFGVLSSTMHMAWVRHVCGRLKSDFRYSNEIVYNNFPWPGEVAERQRQAVVSAAQGLLDVRAGQRGQSLADLYDVDVMPTALLNIHRQLDRAVDLCYRLQPFESDLARVRLLFERYLALTQAAQESLPLPNPRTPRRRARKRPGPEEQRG